MKYATTKPTGTEGYGGEVSRVIKPPKDIEYRAIYEPDMDRMVRALRVLLEWVPDKEKETEQDHANVKTA